MVFKEEAEHLGIGQESGEWLTEEEDKAEEKLSGNVKNGMRIRRAAATTKIVCA